MRRLWALDFRLSEEGTFHLRPYRGYLSVAALGARVIAIEARIVPLSRSELEAAATSHTQRRLRREGRAVKPCVGCLVDGAVPRLRHGL